VTVAGTSTNLPITIKKNFPLKDQPAPNFILSDQLGRQCSLHDTIKLGRPIILFFFPLAGSPHCTQESCLFRDAIELTPIFNVLQAIVIGVSQDPPERAKKFTDLHRLSYPILFDYKRKVMEQYGVGRTTFGLLDNRATFIIDPSGVVRGLAEGVLNAIGHLKFAEKWLIRLEDELSERSKQYQEYVAKDGDMIANMDSENNRTLQVVYGDQGTAKHGGIDGVPRYGAASVAPPKESVLPTSRRRLSIGERPSRGRSDTQTSVENGGHEKNMWKNWKTLLSQLSSPDDVPPPIVTSRVRQSSDSFASRDSPNGSRQSRDAGWGAPSNPTRTLSRRSKSPFGKRAPRLSETASPPPVPRATATPPRVSSGRLGWVDPLDGEAEGVKSAGNSVRNSISSTPPSSFGHARIGSQSSHHTVNSSPLVTVINSNSSSGHSKVPVSASSKAAMVTSEVLMVEGTITTRRTSSMRLSSPPLSPQRASMSQNQDAAVKTNGNTPLLSTLKQMDDTLQDEASPRRSSGPSDVPEDATPDQDDMTASQTSLNTKPLPQTPPTPSPRIATRQLAISPSSSPLQWARGLGRNRSASTDGHSSPLAGISKLRSKKGIPPPVVTSSYAANSVDSGYGSGSLGLSSDSDIKLTSLEPFTKTANTRMHRSVSSLSQRLEPTLTTSLENVPMPISNHPISSGRRSRTHSLAYSNGHEDGRRTPTMSSPGRGVASSLVLESLSVDNLSHHSLHHIDSSNTTDDTRTRLIPRKAPPPLYEPPTQVIAKSPIEEKEPPPSNEGSPLQSYSHSFQDSRRASAAGSVRSTGTFG
jgi:peroxiredoxin